MSNFALPRAAALAEMPRAVRLQIASPGAEPPDGDGWLHEIKYDGHRLVAIVAGDKLTLLSRNGGDRTAVFREPFRPMVEAGLPPMVLDGEIAVPDDRGVTHIDALLARRYGPVNPSGSLISPSICCTSTATICAAARSRTGRHCCLT